jgi:hypothetical protein
VYYFKGNIEESIWTVECVYFYHTFHGIREARDIIVFCLSKLGKENRQLLYKKSLRNL